MTAVSRASTERSWPAPPERRPSRVVIEPVSPVVDGGRFAAKASLGAPVRVVADVFVDGHDRVAAAVRVRGPSRDWTEMPMRPLGNDRWVAQFAVDELGRWEYEVGGWLDHFTTWRAGHLAKVADGQDVSVDAQIGLKLLDAMASRVDGADRALLLATREALAAGDVVALQGAAVDAAVWRSQPRAPMAATASLPFRVERERARFSAWYELFPRSTATGGRGRADDAEREDGPAPGEHATLRDVVHRLDHVEALGFDVLYLPPIHPIGTTMRKGPNNRVGAGPGDPGSPWAIGSPEGGHTAVHPVLGTIDDVVALADACRTRGIDLALDIAFQCSPDHPWVSEHPEWFAHRPDGTVQYAENPPKRYEDIYPLNFESDRWAELWEALRGVFLFWIDHGVKVFRVDNPHTKAFAFWEWAVSSILDAHPDVIFLSEAFTRPRVMQRLAKLGFNQSYTYFAWRQSSWELRSYFTELATETVDFLRPNAWPNTPDILTEQLQTGGRAAFVSRAVLAATLAASWGVYGPAFELLEHTAIREGSEEYLDSEKYQLRHWDLDRPDSLAPLLARLNDIRKREPALAHLSTLHFHESDNPAILVYSKTDPNAVGNPVLVVVNLDSHQEQSGTVDIDWARLGLPYDSRYDLVDRLGGGSYRWEGSHNFVRLGPWSPMAHVFSVKEVTTDDERLV